MRYRLTTLVLALVCNPLQLMAQANSVAAVKSPSVATDVQPHIYKQRKGVLGPSVYAWDRGMSVCSELSGEFVSFDTETPEIRQLQEEMMADCAKFALQQQQSRDEFALEGSSQAVKRTYKEMVAFSQRQLEEELRFDKEMRVKNLALSLKQVDAAQEHLLNKLSADGKLSKKEQDERVKSFREKAHKNIIARYDRNEEICLAKEKINRNPSLSQKQKQEELQQIQERVDQQNEREERAVKKEWEMRKNAQKK